MATVKFLSHLADTCGTRAMPIDAPTVGALLTALVDRFGPELETKLKSTKVLVNGRNVTALGLGKAKLAATDEVTLLPPIAGG
jgi:MoaD family protein